jgi:hypothetical protein
MAKASTLWVRGWLFRDVDGRQKHRRAIMDFFAPIPTLAAMASHAIAEGRRNTDVLVGVHLRRGDYRAWSGGRHFYDDATMVRILAQLVKLLAPRRCRFLLASNEAISLESYQSLDVLPAPGHPVGDLYSLAGCDYIIGPPSTYTLWAGWYGESLVHHVTDPQTPLQLSDFG